MLTDRPPVPDKMESSPSERGNGKKARVAAATPPTTNGLAVTVSKCITFTTVDSKSSTVINLSQLISSFPSPTPVTHLPFIIIPDWISVETLGNAIKDQGCPVTWNMEEKILHVKGLYADVLRRSSEYGLS